MLRARPLDPAQENIDAIDGIVLKAFEGQEHEAHIQAHLIFGSTPMVAGIPPVAIALQKHILEHVKIGAREQAAVSYLQQVQQKGGQAASEEEMLAIEGLTAQFVAQGLQKVKEMSQQMSGQGPDPLVQLKEKELELKAQESQQDAQMDQAELALDQQTLQERQRQFNTKIQSQERQTTARIDAAREREIMKQRAG